MASESVKVVVRCRPMNDRERALNCKAVVSLDSDRGQCFIEKPGAAEEPPKHFTFDGAYCTQHTTEQMYNEVAYPLVEVTAESGGNSCCRHNDECFITRPLQGPVAQGSP